MINKITETLKANKQLLNSDLYIQFEKSVRNTDITAPYQWIDGLQLNEKTNKVTLWLSTENSELIHPIAIERIERNEELLKSINEALTVTLRLHDYTMDEREFRKIMPNLKKFTQGIV